MKFKLAVSMLLAALAANSAFAVNEVQDRDALRKKFGLDAYSIAGKLKDLKVAVLDNGFTGYAAGKGYLPESAEMPTLTQIGPASSEHGLGMAQIIWAMTGKLPEGPKFYLLNTNGFTNLKASVDYAIQQKVDIILYSQIWPFGSNFDGTGFINEQVNRATSAGIIWINAAGNDGNLVYNGQVVAQMDPATRLIKQDGRDYLRLENKFDQNEIVLTLSWTDFQASESYNTDKDLDLFVYDENGKLVGSGELIQKGEAPPAGSTDSKLSSHARETVTLTNLDRGNYQIKVKVNSNNFEAKDRLRIMVKASKPIEFTDKTRNGEIMPPADNPNVITVGDVSEGSAIGPTVDGRTKPDVKVEDSTVVFTNGQGTEGTSNAAALVAGVVTAMKAAEPRMTAEGLRKYIGSISGGSSLQSADGSALNPWIKSLMPAGSQVMKAKRGYFVILTPQDPLSYDAIKKAGAYRVHDDDFILASPSEKRFGRHPRNEEWGVNPPWVEFRYIGMAGAGSGGMWRTPLQSELSKWIN